MRTCIRTAMGLLAITTPLAAQPTSPAATAALPFPKDSLARIVRERVESGRSTGLIVGVRGSDGSSFHATAGNERAGKPIDTRTLFEIGSITKAFTGILLADMSLRGEVRLDQPVAELLPRSVKVPSRNGRQITLADLASQVSGLPRLPENMRPANTANPYADYTVAQLYEFLNGHELRRDPGAQYEYSNLGVGLLGHALALRAGMSYEALVRERILAPLGMSSTAITLSGELRQRMSEGHDPAGQVVPLWDLPTLAGAGALRSSLDDMMRFANAVASPPATPVGRAIRLSLEPRFTVNPRLSLALNWHRVVMGTDTVAYHNGGTAGFRTFVGVNTRTGAAVVLLGNSSQDNEDVARHVLVGMPLIAIQKRAEVTLPADVLAQYPGEYRLTPQFAITITLDGGALQLQATGQPRFPLFAEAKDRFFLKVVDAQIEFARDAAGAVTALTLVQNGARQLAERVQAANDTSLLRVDSVWARNYAVHDTATAMQLMADDFFMTATNGAIKNRLQEMGDVRPGSGWRVLHFRTEQVRARLHGGGNAGVVTGVADWAVESGGRTTPTRRRYTAVYEKGGPLGWRLVALHMGRAE